MRISDWSSDVCSSDLEALSALMRRQFKPTPVRLTCCIHVTCKFDIAAERECSEPPARTPFVHPGSQFLADADGKCLRLHAEQASHQIMAKLMHEHERPRSEEHTSELQSLMRTSYA